MSFEKYNPTVLFVEPHLLISKPYKFYNKTYISSNNRVMKI